MRKENRFKLFAVVGTICLSLFFHTSLLAADTPSEIKVGIVAPLSGGAAWAGLAIKEGVELAVDEVNALGGIQFREYGKKIPVKVIWGDGQSKPVISMAVAEKMIARDKVHYLVGSAFHSSVTMAVMELAPKYNIPIQSFMPVSNAISDKIKSNPKRYWNFWKGDFGSDAYGRTIHQTYQYLIEKGLFKPKNKTIAFVVEETDFGRSNAEVSYELMKKDGWKRVAFEVVPHGHNDFYPQLTKIRSLKPDVVVSCFTALNSGVSFVKQFKETGITSSHMAIFYPLYGSYFTKQVKEAANHLVWTPLLLNPAKSQLQSDFQKRFKKKYNKDINNQNGAGYDGMLGIVKAFEVAGSVDVKKVVRAIAASDYDGVLGHYKYNQERHEIMDGLKYIPIPTAQIIDGQSKIIWPKKLAHQEYIKEPWIK